MLFSLDQPRVRFVLAFLLWFLLHLLIPLQKAYCVIADAVVKLFKSEGESDRVDSVYRDRCVGAALVLHLAVPLLPLGTVDIPLVFRL